MTQKKRETPLLDQLEKGPWPSFVKELKKSADNPMTNDLLGLLERSYKDKIGHWSSYRAFNEHTLTELADGTLDDWFDD